ncbi:MAG: S-layer homology domain-containing protein [Firmicutes bacterium]|nr:S-layer homology domain-containing protein [Bacillota bacterium]
MDWAVANGVSDGTNPEALITREQLVTMLYRYAGKPAVSGSLSAFSDASEVSPWAYDAMVWAVDKGIIVGYNNKLTPKANATCEQVAAIMARFDKLMK